MKVFVPRKLRKKFSNKSGTVDQTKSKAFRRCALISKQFIHQSASALASPALATKYERYCELTIKGTGFRKGG